jgi:hypothetical protein
MERKERIKKFDDKLFNFFVGTGILTVCIVILWLNFKITLVPLLMLLISPFASLFILLKGIVIYSPDDAFHCIVGITLLSGVSWLAIAINHGKHEAYLNKWIYGGEVKRVQGPVVSDEGVEHNETFYKYVPELEAEGLPSKAIDYTLTAFLWAPVVNGFLACASSKKYPTEEKKQVRRSF